MIPIIRAFSSLLIATLFIGCATSPTPIAESPQELQNSVTSEVTYKSMFPRSEWKQFTLDALEKHGKELLAIEMPKDAETFGYKGGTLEERKAFWLYLISAMAWRESGLKPETKLVECSSSKTKYKNAVYKEGFGWCLPGGHKLDNGIVISRGLIQMSLTSAQSYNCDAKNPQDLHDPKINIECAVRVLNKWIVKDGYIGSFGWDPKKRKDTHLGGGRYWSVLRETSGSRPEIIAKMKDG